MTDYEEEQALEIEALESIYTEDYEKLGDAPLKVGIRLVPFPGEEEKNHVAVKAIFSLPPTYPDVIPDVTFEVAKGLKPEQIEALSSKIAEEAENSVGMPMVYTLVEVVKEWLEENNVEEKTDDSMYADMMARQEAIKEEERKREAAAEAERKQEEAKAVKEKANKYGTPVTPESFLAWREKYKLETQPEDVEEEKAKKLTGREHFQLASQGGKETIKEGEEALQAEIAEWDKPEADVSVEGVEEALFLEGDEDDLDDLDSDDEDDEDDDDDEEEDR